jgi:hypothetical protein
VGIHFTQPLNRLQNIDFGRHWLQEYFFTFDGAANRGISQVFSDTAIFLGYVNLLQDLMIYIEQLSTNSQRTAYQML